MVDGYSDSWRGTPCLMDGDSDVKRRALPWLAVESDGTPVSRLDDVFGERQAQAGSFSSRLGGEPGLEDFGLQAGWNAGAGIPDGYMDHSVFLACRDCNSSGALDGLGSVHQDVQEHLVEQLRVALHFGQFAQIGLRNDAAAELGAGELQSVAQVLIEIDLLRLLVIDSREHFQSA